MSEIAGMTTVFPSSESKGTKKILSCRVGTAFKLGDEPRIYLHLSLRKEAPETIIYIKISELLKMTDFKKTYKLECGFEFTPCEFNIISPKSSQTKFINFEEVLGVLIPRLYRKKYITAKEYCEFAAEIYDWYYRPSYHSESWCIYNYYLYYIHNMLEFDENTQLKYIPSWMKESKFLHVSADKLVPDKTEVYNFLESLFDVMDANGILGGYRKCIGGGEFVKCYTDSEDRVRPITSRKVYGVAYPYGCVFIFLIKHFLRKTK